MRLSMFYLLVTLYVILLGSGRLLISNNDLGYDQFWLAVLLDVFFALFIVIVTLILKKFKRFLSLIFILLASIIHLANMEYILALNHTINLVDLQFAGDANFISGTFSHLNFPLYTLFILVTSFLIVYWPKIELLETKEKLAFFASFGLILLIFVFIFTPSQSNWKQGNFIYITLNNSLKSVFNQGNEYSLNSTDSENIEKEILPDPNDQGNILVSKSDSKRNVLIVVLEGIPGAYLEKNQEIAGVHSDIKLTSLNKIIEQSVIVPNFLTHNNQTIRGLYSIISGDYPKLTSSTPKAYEYFQEANQEDRRKHLPQLLKEKGYNTAYIQAAPLDYMSKDRFMQASGFQQILGKETLTKQYVPFGWGSDDKAFFEQAKDVINNLNHKSEPWFATLLTVGTHHPYAAPEDYVKQYGDRKEASIAYLDSALSSFIDYLEQSKILENTLVLFVSDESHGVKDQLLGSNWGLSMAVAPEITSTIINSNVFGHIDLLHSIMDYIDPENNNSKGRSIFRSYNTERPILFANHYTGDIYYLKEKGTIYQINNSNELFEIYPENKQLFSGNYQVEKMNDNLMIDQIKRYQFYADQSIISGNKTNQKFDIVDSKNYKLEYNTLNSITDGQFIDIPENSIVSIEFEYELKDYNDQYIKFLLSRSYGTNVITKVTNKSKGKLYYKFYTPERLVRFSFVLSTFPFFDKLHNQGISEINISNLSISYRKKNKGDETYTVSTNFKEYSNVDVNKQNLIPHMLMDQAGIYQTTEEEIILKDTDENKILVFGPYFDYPEGDYVLRYKFELPEGSSNNFLLDVTTDLGGTVIAKKSFSTDELSRDGKYFIAEVPFELSHDAKLEFRLTGIDKMNVIIKEISVK